jgi:hypothetical protein
VLIASVILSGAWGLAAEKDPPVAPEPVALPAPVKTAPGPDNQSEGHAATPPPTKPEPWRPDGRCDRCGDCRGVKRLCVKTLTEKEITKICWGYRCETVCIPGPSVFCGTRHHRDDCGCWTCWLWKPTCAEVLTKRVPEKQEVKRKIPAVTWSVEERCCRCRQDREAIERSGPRPPVGTQ